MGPPRGGGGPRGRGFHRFKAPYLRKYNNLPRPDSLDGSDEKVDEISFELKQKLSTKKDLDGRFMYPLT
jgi:hypothetical protein